ncbi:DUF771 domain-containing protein [Lactobacillus reuteri]|uniref:DUF771 domain-containing protein n=1 Tax=Limosilactobacillus reuteri TaxID=1598 RepID=UPI00146CFB2E|nr:DUF771 domain-containing protein [Limosilactobacillus reuteri]NMV54027.1 DUF771 domain-containing protein [Limosilactobacillus reuteri]NMV57470.1 DUF771 domain-containing protein [Limosilactobacillus reuteri]
MAQLYISKEQINSAVREAAKELDLVPREDLRAYCPPLDDVRKDYFRNHSKKWIRNLIFGRFPETLDVNGGWAVNPSGKEPGMRGTYVKFEQMKQWLDEHDDEIDWYERLATD